MSKPAKSEEVRVQKILIVEDEPDMVLGLKDNFEFEGYEVVTASDGAAGLERARSDKPDLVILDQQDAARRRRSLGFLGHAASLPATGSTRLKVLPLPGALSSSTLPPCASMMCCTSDSPSPLPLVSCTRLFSAR